jgi:hypothetical protein
MGVPNMTTLTTLPIPLDRIANPEREISSNIFCIAANLLSSLSEPLPLRIFALRSYLFAFPAAASLTPAATATTDTAAALPGLVAVFMSVRRRSRSFPLHNRHTLAPPSRVPACSFGGCCAV